MQLSSRAQGVRQRFGLEGRTLIAAAIVAGVLALMPAISLLYVLGRLDPLLALAGSAGVFVAIRLSQVENKVRNGSGIALLVLSAGMLSFVSLPTGRESRIPLSMVVALALVGWWLFSMLFGASRTSLRASPINRPLLLFVAVNIISYVWSLIFRDPLLFVWSSFPFVQVAALMVNILLPLTLLFVANQVTEVRWLKYVTAVLLLFGAISLVLFFVESRVGDFFFYRGTRGLFSMWTTALAYALLLFHKGLKPWQRALLLLLILALIYRYFFVGRSWVSGWLPLGVACMILTWMRSRRLFLILALAGSIYIGFTFDFYYQNIVVAEEEGGSGTGRVELWMINLNHVANHPLFGMGPAGYAPYNMTYHREDARSTHNNYFDLLAQTGVIGFATFLVLIARLTKVGRRSLLNYTGQGGFEEAFAAATLSGLVGMLVGMMLGDWALPFAYNETIAGFDNAVLSWVLLGGMVALEAIGHSTPNAATVGEAPNGS
jgi:O-antigen ligase